MLDCDGNVIESREGESLERLNVLDAVTFSGNESGFVKINAA